MTHTNTSATPGGNGVINRARSSSRRHHPAGSDEDAFWRGIERDLKKSRRIAIRSAK